MGDLTRITGPSSPLQGASAKIIAVIVIGVLVAIIKPWGAGPAPVARATTQPLPSASPAAATHAPFDPLVAYDHEVFGIHEPAPNWELWPAGYLVSFGFAMRIDSSTPGSIAPSAAPSGTPSGGAPLPSRRPLTDDPGAGQPAWPAAITLTAGSHLALIGINTPLGFSISGIRLERLDTGGSTPVATVKPPSRWPSHFTVVGMDDGSGRETRESWPPGHYRLDLEIDPGGISRTIEIVIGAPAPDDTDATAAPSSGFVGP